MSRQDTPIIPLFVDYIRAQETRLFNAQRFELAYMVAEVAQSQSRNFDRETFFADCGFPGETWVEK